MNISYNLLCLASRQMMLQINNWYANEPKIRFRWLLSMYSKDVVNELSCVRKPHSWRRGHNRLSMDDLPLMNHREWSVKSCPLRPSAITHGLYSYPNCINVMCLTRPRPNFANFFFFFFFFLPHLISDLTRSCHQHDHLGEVPQPADLGPLSSEEKTGLCNSAQTWGGVRSVWSTTVVPGKDLNRFITKASCGVVCAAVSACVRASVCVCVCVRSSVWGRGEERRGCLRFPFQERERESKKKKLCSFFLPPTRF